jgi:hypothetical protein
MNSFSLAQKVESLLRDLDGAEPLSFDLGTPDLPETDAVHSLVSMGPVVVPYLLEHLQRKDPKKRIAYIVLVLNHLGDARALAPLLALRTRYQEREIKNEWDYAIIGQCNLAIRQLQERV